MPWLYEHTKENKDDVELHIHSEDKMMISWTYQHLMDVAVANYGRPMTEEKLNKALKDQLDMAIEDMIEGFELSKNNMIREINKGG